MVSGYINLINIFGLFRNLTQSQNRQTMLVIDLKLKSQV